MSLHLKIDQETSLTLVEPQHAPEFLSLIDRSRSYLGEWLGWLDLAKTVADLQSFIDTCTNEFAEKRGLSTGIWHQDKIVGMTHLKEVDHTNKKAMIGYWVGEEYRGNGFAKRASRTLIDFAFHEWGLNRIEIRCATGNIASQTIPAKLGFQKEGVLRDNEWLHGHFVDHVVYGLVKKDWVTKNT